MRRLPTGDCVSIPEGGGGRGSGSGGGSPGDGCGVDAGTSDCGSFGDVIDNSNSGHRHRHSAPPCDAYPRLVYATSFFGRRQTAPASEGCRSEARSDTGTPASGFGNVTLRTPAYWADGPPRGPPWPRPLDPEDVVVEMVEDAASAARRWDPRGGRGGVGWTCNPGGEPPVLLRRGTTLPASSLAWVPTGRPRGLPAGASTDAANDAASTATNRGATAVAGGGWGRTAPRWASLSDLGVAIVCGEREHLFYDRQVLTSVQVDDVSAWLVEAVPLAALQRVSAALMADVDHATAAELDGDAAADASPNRRPSRLQAALDQRLMMVAEATGKRAMAEAEADAGGPPGARAAAVDPAKRGPIDWEAAVSDAALRARPGGRQAGSGGAGGGGRGRSGGGGSSAKRRRPLGELLAERSTLQETLSRFEAQLESFCDADGEELAEMLRPAMRELAEQLRLVNAQIAVSGGDAAGGSGSSTAGDGSGAEDAHSAGGDGPPSVSSSTRRRGRPSTTSGGSVQSSRASGGGGGGLAKGDDAASVGSAESGGSGGLVMVVGTAASDGSGGGTYDGDIDAFFTDDTGSGSDGDYSLATSIHEGSVGHAGDVPPTPPPRSYDTSSSDDGGGGLRRPSAPPRRRRPPTVTGSKLTTAATVATCDELPPASPLTPEGALYSDFETPPQSAGLSLLDDPDAGGSSDLEVRSEEAKRARRRRVAAAMGRPCGDG